MKCPHCAVAFSPAPIPTLLGSYPPVDGQEREYGFRTQFMICPECNRPIVILEHGFWLGNSPQRVAVIGTSGYQRMVHPAGPMRPCASDVPKDIKQDFEEACAVLPFSLKASAALSRRCLQQVLTDHQGAVGSSLHEQIENFIETKHPPAHIKKQLHAVRQIGNFAAHPQKDNATGQILPVEPEEADWNLDVLDGLFDFVFVQPALAQKRIDSLNNKLKLAKKPKLQ